MSEERNPDRKKNTQKFEYSVHLVDEALPTPLGQQADKTSTINPRFLTQKKEMAKGTSYRPEMVNYKLESISAGWASVVDFCKHGDGCFDSVTSTKLICYLNS